MSNVLFTELVKSLLAKTSKAWAESPIRPVFGIGYSQAEQSANEVQLSPRIEELAGELKSLRQRKGEQKDAYNRLAAQGAEIARLAFGLDRLQIEALQTSGLTAAAAEFVRQARAFDPGLDAQALYQASRNVWTMNLLQLLAGQPVEVTPSVLAYSLLYPYTDNYLDDPDVSIEEKAEFNLRFRRRLRGEKGSLTGSREAVISELVGMIESQFPRDHFPPVYESLLAIHRSQERSVQLLQHKGSAPEVDVLEICIEKGGTSVLAGGWLACGCLTYQQQELLFHYGAFTQLFDDLQDVQEDLKSGLMTVFSQPASCGPLDAVTGKMLSFGSGVLTKLTEAAPPLAHPVLQIMEACTLPMAVEAVFSARQFYSPEYVYELQNFFPVSFGYYEEQHIKYKMQDQGLLDFFAPLVLSAVE